MDPITLTRRLVDIESVTGNEAEVGDFLAGYLRESGWQVQEMPVADGRCNLYAGTGAQPEVVFSTHMDTVPPFIPSSEDADNVYGRGACDAKGILAAEIGAAERLREQGMPVGLLFLVGEEVDSAGAKLANRHAAGSRFLINGEPTQNRLVTVTKGTLGVDLVAEGRLAHSAYPHLGESAIEKLLDALQHLRQMDLPSSAEVGPTTLNVGVISGGQAPNVVADRARAVLLYRLAGEAAEMKQRIQAAVGHLVKVRFVIETPLMRLRAVEGVPTIAVPFTTDIPHLGNWGEPLLLGPGSVEVAHTEREFVAKRELLEAVGLYCKMAEQLLMG